MEYFLGIDPGKTGALALLDARGCPVLVEDWPGDEIGAASILKSVQAKYGPSIKGAIELVGARPKESAKLSFMFGRNFGAWLALLAAFGIQYRLVAPQVWQKGTIFETDGSKKEDRSLAAGRRAFPAYADSYLKRKKDNGRADALLIARWLWMQHGDKRKDQYDPEDF